MKTVRQNDLVDAALVLAICGEIEDLSEATAPVMTGSSISF